MTDVQPQLVPAARIVVDDREGTNMLLHEALARSRHQEAVAVAREHALARQLVAGRRWALLARYAERRAARARAAAGVVPASAVPAR